MISMKILNHQFGYLLMTVLFISLYYNFTRCRTPTRRLTKLSEWTKLWQMKINVDKCAVIMCTRSLSPIQYNYTLSGHEIAIKECHVYLGVEIDNNLKWSSHKQTISNKSTKVLNFIKCNFYNCPADTKRIAYLT